MQVKGADGVSGSGGLDHVWKKTGKTRTGATRTINVKPTYTPAQTKKIVTNWRKTNGTTSTPVRKKSSGVRKASSAAAAASSAALPTSANSSEYESYSGGYDSGAVDDGWNSYLEYMRQLREQAQKAAEDAYNRTVGNINSSYADASNNMRSNLDSALNNLKSVLGNNQSKINQDAENSQQQAYINKMLSERNLQQKMTAQGLSGGAAESTIASLANNYGNARNQIDTQKENSLGDLLQKYQGDVATANQNYNDALNNLNLQKMSALNNAETALNNQTVSNFNSFTPEAPDYTSLISSLAGYSFAPTSANNPYQQINTQQAAGIQAGNNSTNYGKYLQQAQLQAATGASASKIRNNLMVAYNNGQISLADLTGIANALGITI